jgi:hypothetical protein
MLAAPRWALGDLYFGNLRVPQPNGAFLGPASLAVIFALFGTLGVWEFPAYTRDPYRDWLTQKYRGDIPKSCGWPRQFKRRVWFHP